MMVVYEKIFFKVQPEFTVQSVTKLFLSFMIVVYENIFFTVQQEFSVQSMTKIFFSQRESV